MNQDREEIERHRTRNLEFIDDLGVENVEVKYFGNVIEPFNDIFDYRYRHGLQTVITTNLPPSEIKETYGDRIASRFRETMNDLILDGEDLRK
jgi:DNA replication protein DnaC